MEQRGLRTGHLMALAGAAGAFATLWAPWYTANLAAVMQAVSPQADRVLSPSLAQQFHAAAALLPSSVSVDAWEIFHRNDILIAVMAGLVALVVIAAAGALGDGVRVSPSASGRACATLGGLCAVLVAIQLVSDPVSNTQVPSSAIHLQWGAYACLASAVAMLVGGLMAGSSPVAVSSPSTDDWMPPTALVYDETARTATSVAPPGIATSSDAR